MAVSMTWFFIDSQFLRKGKGTIAAYSCRVTRCLRGADFFPDGLVKELLRLEIVFSGRIEDSVDDNGVGREIGEAPVLSIHTIEHDGLHFYRVSGMRDGFEANSVG